MESEPSTLPRASMWLLVVSFFFAVLVVVGGICIFAYHLSLFAFGGDPFAMTLMAVVVVLFSNAVNIFHFAIPAGNGKVIPSLNLIDAPPISILEWRMRLVRLAIIWGFIASAPLIFATWVFANT